MSEKQTKLAIFTMSICILLCIAGKCLALYFTVFDMDRLDALINPTKEHISLNSRIGFDTNMNDTESYELYKAVKYVMTPYIFLYKTDMDTLIVIQSKEKLIKDFRKYRVVSKNEDKESIVILLTKLK
jgi:hypothetical protein